MHFCVSHKIAHYPKIRHVYAHYLHNYDGVLRCTLIIISEKSIPKTETFIYVIIVYINFYLFTPFTLEFSYQGDCWELNQY